jgi:glucan phosphoethanolaminetransferase (alkaline phosphatase superfamily)
VLTRVPERRPNVFLVILESVRADAVCESPNELCRKTPYSHALTPGRHPLTQMRSQASSTAISLAVLWSGVDPQESRDVLHTWPLIFDYAKAAGYSTAFWTSQNMMFGNARLWVKNLGVDQFVSATELDPVADLDMGAPEHLLADHVNQHIGDLPEPFLAVVQLSNVHYPYYLDPEGPTPFQPMTTSKDPDHTTAFFNLYLNAVHQQDRHVGAMIEGVKKSRFGDRTVIVYTSDHGEAFREHNQMGHTFSIFDEEVHVPAWIDAPRGTLDATSVANLDAKRDEYLFHTDLAGTVIDLLGVWNDPAIAKYRRLLHGSSLLRRERSDRAVPLTNCAGVWSCAFENWGYMRGPLKLEARSWDPDWRCFDVSADPLEQTNLGPDDCRDLLHRTLATFGRLPGKQPD